jgi:DNA invertase Pin-like site-specific DNA recombinase
MLPQNTSKQAIGYLRASTDESKQRNSLAVQQRAITAFSRLHGYEIVDWVSEYGSGKDDNRKGFTDALRRSQAEGLFVIAAKADRLSRSLGCWDRLEGCRSRLRIAELGDEVVSELHLSLLLVIGSNERGIIAQRIKDTYQHLKAIHGDELKWGNPNIRDEAAKSIAIRKNNAGKHNDRIKKLAKFVTEGGGSISDAVDYINSLGITTRRGKAYTYANLCRMLRYQA